MEKAFRNTNNIALERIALVRKSYSAFALMESRTLRFRNSNRSTTLIASNLQSLLDHRNRFIHSCEASMSLLLCRERFRKEFLRFDIILGLNYFYRGEEYKSKGEMFRAFQDYGMALSLLENPGDIDPNLVLLAKDPLPRRARIRNLLNLARIHIRLGDLRKANQYWKDASEYAYEFRLEKEQFVSDLVRIELVSFGGIQPGSAKSRTVAGILDNLKTRYDTEETVFWELPHHILDEMNRSAIHFAIQNNRPWDVPPIRDRERQKKFNREAINSSLEFSNLELDSATKDYQNTIKAILSTQRRIEDRSISREKLGDLYKDKLRLRKILQSHSSKIQSIDKNYATYYSQPNYKIPAVDTNSQLIRCFDMGDRLAIWTNDSKNRSFHTYPKDIGRDIVNSLLVSEYDSFYINPDNCSFLYRHIAGGSDKNIQLVTMDSDVRKNSIREGIDWRFRTVLVDRERSSNHSRLNFTETEDLGYRLLDTDLLFVTNSLLEDDLPVFSYKGKSSLNLREVFTQRSELAAIVLEVEDLGRWDWENINMTYYLARSGKEKNLIITKKLTDEERQNLGRENLPAGSIVFGVLPKKIQVSNPISRYRELRAAAIFKERGRDYNSAYDLYYDAGSFLSDEEELVLENDIDLARMKRKIFPNKDPDYFYRSLFQEYQSKPKQREKILTDFLIDCFSDRSIETNRAQCEIYYYDWNARNEVKSSPVRFFYRMYRGHTRDILNDLNVALEFRGMDDFIKKMKISDLFLENFLFKESMHFANIANSVTVSPREKELVESRILEIQFHKAYILGETEFTYKKINAPTTYALGYNREWDKYIERVYSPSFRRLGDSDNIFEDYRKRMYQKWRNWEFGEEFESQILIPDELYGGGSVLSKLSHLNRSLLFFLIMESSKHQISDESDSLIDQIIEQEEREGFYNRAFAYALFYADQLMRNGNMESAYKYIQYFETKYNAKLESHPLLESKYSYLVMKLSRYNDRIVFFEDSVNLLRDDDKEIYNLIQKMEEDGVDGFPRILNDWFARSNKKNAPFTPKSRRKAEDLIQYMKRLSLSYDSTEGFLDAIHYEQTLLAYNERTLGRKPYHGDIPAFQSIHAKLTGRIPKDQELSVVNDFLGKTYLIQVANGKTKGRELFSDTKPIKSNLRRFYQAAYEGGSESRIRDVLEDRYRNSLRLNKDSINYLYLTGYHLTAPFLQKSDTRVFQVQNLSSLLTNPTTKLSELTWRDSLIQTRRETNFNPPWFKNLKSVEDWELQSISRKGGQRITVSQEELGTNNIGYLQYGGEPIASLSRKSMRSSVWIMSSNQLGYPYLLSGSINQSLYHLDRIHTGVGVISLEDQSDFNQSYFMKSMLVPRNSNTELRFRFLNARDLTRNRYRFDKYWVGYRIYTSSIILP